MNRVFILVMALVSLVNFKASAIDVDVLVRNQRFNEDTLFFDIYLESTSSNNLYLSNSDFALQFTEANFTNPTLNLVAGSINLVNAYGNATAFYDTNIGTSIHYDGLNAFKLMIVVQMPVYSNQGQFFDRIARIDGQSMTHRLGTFYITGATELNTNPQLSWVTSGKGLKLLVNHRDSVSLAKTTALSTGVNPSIASQPTVQADGLAFANITSSSLTVNWNAGNGTNRILLIRQASAVNAFPVDGITYIADTVFQQGDHIDTSDVYVVYKGSGTSVNISGLNTSTTYHFALLELNGEEGWNENYLSTNPDTLSQTTNGAYITANVKVFLQGAYDVNTSQMRTDLNSNGIIPLTQPYSLNKTGWNYNGQESVSSIPNSDIVDWVLIELRTGVNADDTLSANTKRAGFLLKDGSVVDTNGVDPIKFYNVATGDYYVIIRHRNHLPIMSVSKITLGVSSGLFNFTTGQGQAYGSNPIINIIGGVFGMIGGDANTSLIITAADRNEVSSQFSATTYNSSDLNLSGIVSAADRNIIASSFNKSSQVID